ncbi:CPBP family intramembrane glutamic endopeptidase [Flavobacterium agrisoli]|uniref:CPBP family intramembrane metalloprotease n=1 Tax=Flavobacterium agrisoli TaxID=2793066 RepID=A0A934UJG8_9FLAO|nr:CPBP family intramembrane glutamic endopeptidase [Flavobacterium agrisoli]MBK0369946.1 CPBP family intramembrane metalloprotease [Flavobacterium agrisoli]
MFLEQAIKPENHFVKYILGLFIIFLASLIGQIPLLVAIQYKTMNSDMASPVTQEDLFKVFDSNIMLVLMLLSFVFVLVATLLVVKYWHRQPVLTIITSRKKIDWKRILFSFSIWGFLTTFFLVLSYWMEPSNFIINFEWKPFLILVVVGVIFIPIPTTAEELVFRGYLMQGFANWVPNRWFPLLMTSLVFGALHFYNPEVAKTGNVIMIYYIGTGLFLGILTLMDEGTELALGFHAANNLFGALLVTSTWTAFQTHSVLKAIGEPSLIWDILVPVLIIYPILLSIFNLKYGWKSWKEKLTGKLFLNK